MTNCMTSGKKNIFQAYEKLKRIHKRKLDEPGDRVLIYAAPASKQILERVDSVPRAKSIKEQVQELVFPLLLTLVMIMRWQPNPF